MTTKTDALAALDAAEQATIAALQAVQQGKAVVAALDAPQVPDVPTEPVPETDEEEPNPVEPSEGVIARRGAVEYEDINRAILELQAGDTLELMPGYWMLDGQLRAIPVPCEVVGVQIDGVNACTLNATNAGLADSQSVLHFRAGGEVRNLDVYGAHNMSANGRAVGVAGAAKHLLVDGCRFQECQMGIQVPGILPEFEILVRNTRLELCGNYPGPVGGKLPSHSVYIGFIKRALFENVWCRGYGWANELKCRAAALEVIGGFYSSMYGYSIDMSNGGSLVVTGAHLHKRAPLDPAKQNRRIVGLKMEGEPKTKIAGEIVPVEDGRIDAALFEQVTVTADDGVLPIIADNRMAVAATWRGCTFPDNGEWKGTAPIIESGEAPAPDPQSAGVLRYATTVKGELSDLDGATVYLPWIVLEPSVPRADYDKVLFWLDGAEQSTHTGDVTPPHTMLWPEQEAFLDVPDGEHFVRAELVMRDGSTRIATAKFTVKRPVVEPQPKPEPIPEPEPIPGGRTFFVDAQNGSDGQDGTEAKPWQSLEHANSKARQPGDTVYLMPGAVWERRIERTESGEAGRPIRWMRAPGIDGPDPVIRMPIMAGKGASLVALRGNWLQMGGIDILEAPWMGLEVTGDDCTVWDTLIQRTRKVACYLDRQAKRFTLRDFTIRHIGRDEDYPGMQDQHAISIRTDAADAGGHLFKNGWIYDTVEDGYQPNADMATDAVLAALENVTIGRDENGQTWRMGENLIDLKGSCSTIFRNCLLDGGKVRDECIVDHSNGSKGFLEFHDTDLIISNGNKGARVNHMDVLLKGGTWDALDRAVAEFGSAGRKTRIEDATFIRRGGGSEPGVILKGEAEIVNSTMHIGSHSLIGGGATVTGAFTRKPL